MKKFYLLIIFLLNFVFTGYTSFFDYPFGDVFFNKLGTLKRKQESEYKDVERELVTLCAKETDLIEHFLYQTASIRAASIGSLPDYLDPEILLQNIDDQLITITRIKRKFSPSSPGPDECKEAHLVFPPASEMYKEIWPTLERLHKGLKALTEELERRKYELTTLPSKIPLFSLENPTGVAEFEHPDYRLNPKGLPKAASEMADFVQKKIDFYNSIVETLRAFRIPNFEMSPLAIEVLLKHHYSTVLGDFLQAVYNTRMETIGSKNEIIKRGTNFLKSSSHKDDLFKINVLSYFTGLKTIWESRLPIGTNKATT